MVYVFVHTQFLYPAQFPTHCGCWTSICWAGKRQLPLPPVVAMPLLYLCNHMSSRSHTVAPNSLPWKYHLKSNQERGSTLFKSEGIYCRNLFHRCQKKLKREMGKVTEKLAAAGIRTPRLEGWKEEVVMSQLRAWECLMEPETTKDTDFKRAEQPLLGRHPRQRREKYSCFSLLWGLSFLSGRPCRTPADLGPRLRILPSPPWLQSIAGKGEEWVWEQKGHDVILSQGELL